MPLSNDALCVPSYVIALVLIIGCSCVNGHLIQTLATGIRDSFGASWTLAYP